MHTGTSLDSPISCSSLTSSSVPEINKIIFGILIKKISYAEFSNFKYFYSF